MEADTPYENDPFGIGLALLVGLGLFAIELFAVLIGPLVAVPFVGVLIFETVVVLGAARTWAARLAFVAVLALVVATYAGAHLVMIRTGCGPGGLGRSAVDLRRPSGDDVFLALDPFVHRGSCD
jgi:hypothetical protein